MDVVRRPASLVLAWTGFMLSVAALVLNAVAPQQFKHPPPAQLPPAQSPRRRHKRAKLNPPQPLSIAPHSTSLLPSSMPIVESPKTCLSSPSSPLTTLPESHSASDQSSPETEPSVVPSTASSLPTPSITVTEAAPQQEPSLVSPGIADASYRQPRTKRRSLSRPRCSTLLPGKHRRTLSESVKSPVRSMTMPVMSSEPENVDTSARKAAKRKSWKKAATSPAGELPRVAKPMQLRTSYAPARTNPYQAPYFFPAPGSPQAVDYISITRNERRGLVTQEPADYISVVKSDKRHPMSPLGHEVSFASNTASGSRRSSLQFSDNLSLRSSSS